MKSKILSFLLSVTIALGLWLYVITVESPNSSETIYNIPVVFEGETALNERGLIITSSTSADVDLTLSGNRSDLKQVNAGNITLKVDLSKIYDPGKHELEYTVSYPGTVAGNAFTEESRTPDRIHVTVEKLLKQEVPVVVTYSGTLPEGYFSDKGNVVLDYSTITVSGPQSVVEKIARAEIAVDLTDRTEYVSESYRFTLEDENGEPVDAEMITVNVEEVHVELKIQKIKYIDLVVTLVDGGGATKDTVTCEINPVKIQVSGSEAALESLGEVINLGTINLAEYTSNTELIYPITLPENVTNHSNITEATVQLKFTGLASKEVTIDNIQLINLPEGMTAELITEKLSAVIRGPSMDVAKFTSENVHVTVDMSDAVAGTSTYKVDFVFDSRYASLGAVGSYTVTVTLTAEEG